MESQVDVVVIGAGLSGIAAATRLEQAGLSVSVLEARDSVGGRLFSRAVGNGVFDLGGQWIGPGQRRIARWVSDLSLQTFPTYDSGKKLVSVRGALRTYSGTIPKLGPLELLELHRALSRVERMHKKLSARTPWKHPDATALDAQTVEAVMGPSLTRPGARAAFDAAVRTVFGAEARELSMLHFLAYLSGGGGLMNLVSVAGGAQQDRIDGGAQQLAALAADRLSGAVLLEAPVRRVVERQARLCVVHDKGELGARYVIVAVPPQLAMRIVFEPALPAAKRHVLEGAAMGATIKVLVTYAKPFWRARGLSGEAVSDAPPFAVVFDNADGDRQAALLGFVVGQPAREFSALPPSRRRTVAVAELCRLYGSDAADLQDYVEYDWSEQPWTLGCPVASPRPGVLSLNGSALRSRCGRIGFAGTETAREYCGYMEGALEAAERAAAEALAFLQT